MNESRDCECEWQTHVYVIAFDQDQFGIFRTREAAEKNLQYQIGHGGPAWDGCQVEKMYVHS